MRLARLVFEIIYIPSVIYLSASVSLRQIITTILNHLSNTLSEIAFCFDIIKPSRKIALALIFPCVIFSITLFSWIMYGHSLARLGSYLGRVRFFRRTSVSFFGSNHHKQSPYRFQTLLLAYQKYLLPLATLLRLTNLFQKFHDIHRTGIRLVSYTFPRSRMVVRDLFGGGRDSSMILE